VLAPIAPIPFPNLEGSEQLIRLPKNFRTRKLPVRFNLKSAGRIVASR